LRTRASRYSASNARSSRSIHFRCALPDVYGIATVRRKPVPRRYSCAAT